MVAVSYGLMNWTKRKQLIVEIDSIWLMIKTQVMCVWCSVHVLTAATFQSSLRYRITGGANRGERPFAFRRNWCRLSMPTKWIIIAHMHSYDRRSANLGHTLVIATRVCSWRFSIVWTDGIQQFIQQDSSQTFFFSSCNSLACCEVIISSPYVCLRRMNPINWSAEHKRMIVWEEWTLNLNLNSHATTENI